MERKKMKLHLQKTAVNKNPTVIKLLTTLAISMLFSSTGFAASEEKVGQVGLFTILRIFEGNDSTRCIASIGSGQSVLRLSISYDKKYAISTPGVRKNSKLIMYIDPPDGDDISFAAQSDGKRSWGSMDAGQFRNFLRIKNEISVQVDGVKFNYPIGTTSLAEVAKKTEQCNK
jgi:hypothetical protein